MPAIKWYRRVEQKAKSVVTSIIAVEDGVQAAAFEKVRTAALPHIQERCRPFTAHL